MNETLKSTITTVKMLCDSLDENGLGVRSVDPSSSKTTYEIFRYETLKMLAYLANVDGEPSDAEAGFINDFLGFTYRGKELGDMYRRDPRMKEIEESPSIFMKIVVNSDNGLLERGVPHEQPACLTAHQLYGLIGREFLACDDEVSDVEVASLTKILNTMRSYYEKADKDWLQYKSKSADGVPQGDGAPAEPESGTADAAKPAGDEIGTLEELMDELNSLIGLSKVKEDVSSLINLVQIMKIRQERGMKQIPVSLHLVFSGNPGTGKTTVARLLSKIYCRIGVLSKGHLVEVDRSGLVSGYVGQTAIKTQEVIQNALGGVLFIDEAYALSANRGENDFGLEAIDTLLKGMEDHRDDLAVIVAGYPDLMEKFLSANPGLKSRFNKFIYFDDYTPEELHAIFKFQCSKGGYTISGDAEEYARKFLEELYENRDENFANGRDVRNFFEKAVVNQANRLSALAAEKISDEELVQLTKEDFEGIEM